MVMDASMKDLDIVMPSQTSGDIRIVFVPSLR